MWFNRIISSFFGIRKKSELSKDLQNISFGKIVLLFFSINLLFICIILIITRLITSNL